MKAYVETKNRFGIVGAGGIAQAYAQAFESCAHGHLVAVADTRLDAACALAERMGCQSRESYQAMAEASTLDAVLVCTPPATHPEVCVYFVERGVIEESGVGVPVEVATRALRSRSHAVNRFLTHLRSQGSPLDQCASRCSPLLQRRQGSHAIGTVASRAFIVYAPSLTVAPQRECRTETTRRNKADCRADSEPRFYSTCRGR
ncbi:MAG: Gfo/Idh/MocA family oxidoreductase [Pyrinomonadaceae bacterium]|nr:Gfo/Idh/MocA family oxidoreductase [Pyrinomonadaceae bacterium]